MTAMRFACQVTLSLHSFERVSVKSLFIRLLGDISGGRIGAFGEEYFSRPIGGRREDFPVRRLDIGVCGILEADGARCVGHSPSAGITCLGLAINNR